MQRAEAMKEIIHDRSMAMDTGELGAVKIACPVRWGVAGKGFAHADTSPAAYPAAAAGLRQKGTAMPEDAAANAAAPQTRVREMQTKLHRWAVIAAAA